MTQGLAVGAPFADPETTEPAVRLRQVVKRYGGTTALKGIDLDVRAGTIHALVGENGAGKSTCLGAIAGRVQPDDGRLAIFGQDVGAISPRRARGLGVVTVYQELTMIPRLSAQANVFLGQTKARWGWLRDREMRTRYAKLCEELDVACYPDVEAGTLSVADQQLLEIMRALIADARIILLDEPTASLAPHERNVLLNVMRGLRDRGITVLFVSHNLDEVLQVSDVITVFREGSIVLQTRPAETTKKSIIEGMLGRPLSDSAIQRRARPQSDVSRIRVEGLTVANGVTDISFDLAPGEILGLGGLVGSGRTTVLQALAGAVRANSGEMWIDGESVRWPRTPRQARSLGFALLPEDRKTQGLNLVRSGADNILISDLKAVSQRGFLNERRMTTASERAATGFGIKAATLKKPAGTLSGGNQQKLLLARWGHSVPRILLADEPTRGIDVGAKQEILEHLNRLAGQGLSIIVVSSELEEVVEISHRVLVLVEGRAVGLLDNADGSLNEHEVLQTIFDSESGGYSSEHHPSL